MIQVDHFKFEDMPSIESVNTILFQSGTQYRLKRMIMFLEDGYIKYTIQVFNESKCYWEQEKYARSFTDKYKCFLYFIKLLNNEFIENDDVLVYNNLFRIILRDDVLYLEEKIYDVNSLSSYWNVIHTNNDCDKESILQSLFFVYSD